MTVSVIIVTWNVRDLLRMCLESLRPAVEEGWVEVIVVDNGSVDGTAGMVGGQYPGIRLIANTENRGFGAANNQGMGVAQAPFLFLLNPDTVVLPQALERLIGFLGTHSRAGVVAPRLLNPDGSLQRNAFRFPGLWQVGLDLFPLHPRLMESSLNGRYPQERTAREPFEIDHPLGAALLVRREVWEQIGGFDENYFMYAEEVDWCWRIRRAGWSIWQVPGAEVVHYGGRSTSQAPDWMFVELWRARYQFFRDHYSAPFNLAARLLVRTGMLYRTLTVSLAAATGRIDEPTAHARRQAAATIFRF